MKCSVASVVVAVVGLALISQSADAAQRHRRGEYGVKAASVVVGAGSTAGFFALRNWKFNGQGRVNGFTAVGAAVVTTMGCLALSPIVGTVLAQRELTYREAYGLTADCIIPFIGSWLVEKTFDAHPEWDPDLAAARQARPAHRKPRHVNSRG